MSDLIDRQAAISAICNACGKIDCDKMDKCEKLQLPPANSSEFPNNSDTISRQAAIDALAEWHDEAITNRLNNLPSAQQWIPCKERLPKPREYEDGIRKYYLIQNEFGDMMVCSWDGKYWEQMYQYKNVRDKVVAWMPLPKPWKGEEK